MAPAHSGTSSGGDIIFNRLNVALAKRQGLLASLMGVVSEDKPNQKPLAKIQQEEDGFSADPELLGIGGKIPHDDEVDRQRRSSNHELKRQLLGRDYEKRQRAKQDLKPNQHAISTPGSAMDRRGLLSQPLQTVEADSEDDAGRSSLGKRKRSKQLEAETRAVMSAEAGEQDEGQGLNDESRLPKSSTGSSLPQAEVDLEKILVQQSSQSCKNKKKKKKKKNRKKKEHSEVQKGDTAG